MLDWVENWAGETAFVVSAIFLLTLSAASDVWEWVVWLKLRRERSPSQVRRGIEFTSLVAGTASMVLFGFFLMGVARWVAGGTDWTIDLWISFVGMAVSGIALLASPFSRGKLRIAGIVVGVIMSAFWWEVWNLLGFARGYAEYGPF
jgi:hypothetical protein